MPELAEVPDAFLQEPWKWPGARGLLGRRYPEPVVDVAAAARLARERLAGPRRAVAVRTGPVLLVEPPDGATGFGRESARRPARARVVAAAQLSLDL